MKNKTIFSIALSMLIGLSSAFPFLNEFIYAEETPFSYPIINVEASSHDGNLPENTIDNNLATRWSAQGVGEWILFDLGTIQEVGYLGIAFHNSDIRKTTVDIELSVDRETWTKVTDQQENSGSSLNLEAYDFEDQNARYIRIVGYGNSSNDWNSITEVHIYAPFAGGPIVEEIEIVPPGPKPGADPFTIPGLYYPDGKKYVPHKPNKVTGRTLDVTDFGADVRNNDQDDTPAIIAAIEEAEFGDEVYFPDGTYNLISTMPKDVTAHFYLKSGVNLRGNSEEDVVLVSYFDSKDVPSSRVIASYGKHEVLISNMTITSTFDGSYSENPGENNPEHGGPGYGIFIADSIGQPSYHITINHVTVEKFKRMGIRIEKSNRNIIENATFKNATDVGGGGAGYGVSIQGVPGFDRLGHPNDTYFNIVRNSQFVGPYIRHGTLIQYFAHNNLIHGNQYTDIIHDAIDLHGQGEYLNEISNNIIDGVIRGGIGVGNTGGTPPNSHSSSGPGNYIHNNTLTDTRDGITVIMGSPDTIIERNTIVNTRGPENAKGIYLKNAPRTIVKENKIINNKAPGFWGIVVAEDFGDTRNGDKGAGIPQDIVIENNKIVNNTNGMKLEAGKGLIIQNNLVNNNQQEDFIDLISKEENDEDEIDYTIYSLNPTDDALIDIERPDSNYGVINQELIDAGTADRNYYKYFNIKSNADKSKGRIAYYQFDIADYEDIGQATFQLTGKTGSNTTSVSLAVYGLTNNDWNEETLTWRNAPNVALDTIEVTGLNETAFYLGTITVDQAENSIYSIDVSSFIEDGSNENVSLMVVDIEGQNDNVNLYSRDEPNTTSWPELVIGVVED
jgi:parallel beta-helix repeat protein